MACELCDENGGDVLWRDERCRVVQVDEPGYPGYCRVIWNAHVKEMTDLSHDERAHCLEIVLAVEATIRELVNPDKINLASLGNMTPHLHWHVIPRLRDDPHFPNAIWSAALRPAQAAGARIPLAKLRAALAEKLAAAGKPSIS